jgi:hypothetical protein
MAGARRGGGPAQFAHASSTRCSNARRRRRRDFAAAWAAAGCAAEFLEVEGHNHYDIVLDARLPGNPLHAAIGRMLGA